MFRVLLKMLLNMEYQLGTKWISQCHFTNEEIGVPSMTSTVYNFGTQAGRVVVNFV